MREKRNIFCIGDIAMYRLIFLLWTRYSPIFYGNEQGTRKHLIIIIVYMLVGGLSKMFIKRRNNYEASN